MARRVVLSVLLVAASSTTLTGCHLCGFLQGGGDVMPVDWNTWFGTRPLPSLAAAEKHFPFELVEPTGLPSPRGIYPRDKVAVAFVYDLRGHGRVIVLESVEPDRGKGQGQNTLAEYQREARDPHGCGVHIEAGRIRGGIPAVASESEGWAHIEWVEQGRQMNIQMRTGTIDEAVAIANRL